MQQLGLVLLLFTVQIARADESEHHVESAPVANMKTNSPMGSRSVIEQTLEEFGINDTEFRTGQILCPPSHLRNGSSYKRKRITIGLAGCFIDPLIAQYTPQQRKVLQEHDNGVKNCSASLDIAGYFPPIPGMFIPLG